MVCDANWKFAEAHNDWNIDKNNNTVSVSLDRNLNFLERILTKQYLNAAYLKVMEQEEVTAWKQMACSAICGKTRSSS